MYKIGVIGAGNMASAIIQGILRANLVEPDDIIVSDIDTDKLAVLHKLGIVVTNNNIDVAKASQIIILAIKPGVYESVLKQLSDQIGIETTLVSIAAGISINYIKSFFTKEIKIIRVMPNTPALIGNGMSVLVIPSNVDDISAKAVKDIFASLGRIEVAEEKLMDAVTAISGSGPAYVFMFIEALADAAVMEGLSRDKAYMLAAQTVMGAAQMVIETKEHPGKLKDMVCSPAGTTIDAVYTLEQCGFRSAIMQAVKVCAEKSRRIGK